MAAAFAGGFLLESVSSGSTEVSGSSSITFEEERVSRGDLELGNKIIFCFSVLGLDGKLVITLIVLVVVSLEVVITFGVLAGILGTAPILLVTLLIEVVTTFEVLAGMLGTTLFVLLAVFLEVVTTCEVLIKTSLLVPSPDGT